MVLNKKTFSIQKKVFLIMFLMLLYVSNTSPTLASSWEEDFTDLDDWSLSGLICPTGCANYPITTTLYSGIEIVDGAMAYPNINTSLSFAVHSSDVLYGSWSWDWEAPATAVNGNEILDLFIMMDNREIPYNTSGSYTWDGSNRYALRLASNSNAGGYDGPGFTLYAYNGTAGSKTLGTPYILSKNIIGKHHFEVTRDLSGEFKVYYDDVLIITGTDNSTLTSVKHVTISSTWGNSKFDNIKVVDLIDVSTTPSETSPGYILGMIIPSLFILVVIRKITKK